MPLVKLVGATPVTITLRASAGFAIMAEDGAAYITPRTKAILVNSPNNPTGRVLAVAEAETIRDAALWPTISTRSRTRCV